MNHVPGEPVLLTKEKPGCDFAWKELPEGSRGSGMEWQVTNFAGIVTPL